MAKGLSLLLLTRYHPLRVWGERLVTLNLVADTLLSFQPCGDHGSAVSGNDAAFEVFRPRLLPTFLQLVREFTASAAYTSPH